MALPLSPPTFAILSGLIEERSGLHYEPRDSALLAEKVSVRAIERGFESLLDYYYYLRYDPEGSSELDTLVEYLVVHESYFFRELRQLEALVDIYLKPIVRAGRPLRIWCAAAACGEEAYTLAMLLAERNLLDRVQILATDISERVLAQARRGEARPRALRGVPPGYERWLHVDGERGILAPEVLQAVEFRRVNLVDPAAVAALGTFDAILCRNALIYFHNETAQRVVESLAARLAPAGVLLVGVSESLLRFGTMLRCEERAGVFFYEKVKK